MSAPPAEPSRNRLIERLRSYFLAGVLVTGPAFLTLYLTWLFIDFIDGAVRWLLPGRYNPYLHIPGMGLVVGAATLTLIGWLTAGYIGRIPVRISELLLARMPIVRGVYGAVKQIFETVLAKQSNTFREAVLVEFPRRGMWTIAFITAQPEGEVGDLAGEDPVGVYVPTTPNPTSGYLVYVPRNEVVTLSMTVEEAIKMVISGGIVTPPDRRPPEMRGAGAESMAPREPSGI